MSTELFGPVLSVVVYPDEFVLLMIAGSFYLRIDREWLKTLSLVNNTSPYALTGAVFARDRSVNLMTFFGAGDFIYSASTAIHQASVKLSDAAGNFYVCRCTRT